MNTTLDERTDERTLIAELTAMPASSGSTAAHYPPYARWALVVLALAGAVAGVAGGWEYFARPAAPAYHVAEIRRGSIRRTISATGKVQAVTTVQVGTQVSGTVSQLLADFNDHVKAGQIIARLDPSQIEAQLQQSKASLAASEAGVAAARSAVAGQKSAVDASKANVDRVDAVVLEATRAYENTVRLVKEGVTPARQVQTDDSTRLQALAQKSQAEAQYAQAKAQADSASSQLAQAEAQAAQARAAVDVATVNLDRTIVRAPIDGVVIARNVDVGQTVAASLQAPVLFLIANDLTKMQVLADVDEADVGQLSPRSKVTFTVDAFPRDTFAGRISQIRLSPAVVQNVVTYTAVINVDNPDLLLKPGMTATVTATVAEAGNVLLAPNGALRFHPNPEQSPASGNRSGSVVWKETAGQLQAVRVQTGMTDGLFTEIRDGTLLEGDRIAMAATQPGSDPQKKQSGAASFPGTGAPKMRRF